MWCLHPVELNRVIIPFCLPVTQFDVWEVFRPCESFMASRREESLAPCALEGLCAHLLSSESQGSLDPALFCNLHFCWDIWGNFHGTFGDLREFSSFSKKIKRFFSSTAPPRGEPWSQGFFASQAAKVFWGHFFWLCVINTIQTSLYVTFVLTLIPYFNIRNIGKTKFKRKHKNSLTFLWITMRKTSTIQFTDWL